jgi:Domain of unknown function (DUF4389)
MNGAQWHGDRSLDPPAGSMSEQPVRLLISDDTRRRRLTVFFRLLLVIPHYLWLAIWGIGAIFAAIANWVATLAAGRSPEGLHRFLALYVKYATHVYAYLLLAADPYPPFDGRAGYPVDVEIAPPARQARAAVLFRLLLFIPAALLAASLFGAPDFGYRRAGRFANYNFGVAHAAAILGWFACLALRRMPRGLRDAVAWGLGFGAQLWAYLFLLTGRYPDPDPEVVLGELPARSDPIAIEAGGELRRSRLTVFFRLLLALPHLVWLTLWAIISLFAVIASWVATLARGRPPAALHRFLSAYLRYQTHVYAFIALVANPFPGFVGAPGSYPVDVTVAAPQRQNRWTVGFRLLLAVPAWILAAAYSSLLWSCALLGWFAALATGSMPRRLGNTGAHALRYLTQVNGYLLLLTAAYPYLGPCRIPGVGGAPAQAAPESAFG